MDIDHPVDLALFLRLPQSLGTPPAGCAKSLACPSR